jgi:hypothetical protein
VDKHTPGFLKAAGDWVGDATINGSGFQQGAQISINGGPPIDPTSVSSTEIRYPFDASQFTDVGAFTVDVLNGEPTAARTFIEVTETSRSDSNDDGNVDAVDLVFNLENLVGNSGSPFAPRDVDIDVDGDGLHTVLDAWYIRMVVAGLLRE